jgi:predicted  nucleic acid-binding Zn-ribbon protein
MAALANMVTQLGALMAANPVATKIATVIVGWFVWNYLCPTAAVNSAPVSPLHSEHPNAVTSILLKPNQQAHVVITENEPERVYLDPTSVRIGGYVFVLTTFVLLRWLLRKLRVLYRWITAPAAAGDDDDRPEDQVRNPNPPTPESESNAVQPRAPDVLATPNPSSRDKSTQTLPSPTAENTSNVADAEAKKKLDQTVKALNSQIAALQQQGLKDTGENEKLTRELATAKAKNEDLEVQLTDSRSQMDGQVEMTTELQSCIDDLDAKLVQSEQSRSDLNDRVTAATELDKQVKHLTRKLEQSKKSVLFNSREVARLTTLQKEDKQALKQVQTELAGSRGQVETLKTELAGSRDQVNTLALEVGDTQNQVQQVSLELADTEDHVQQLTRERDDLKDHVNGIVKTHFDDLHALHFARQNDLSIADGHLKYRDGLIEGIRETLKKEQTLSDELATRVWHLEQELQTKNNQASAQPQQPDAHEETVTAEVQVLETEAPESGVEPLIVDTHESAQPQHPIAQEEISVTEVQVRDTETSETKPEDPVVDTQAQEEPKIILPPHLRHRPAKAAETGPSSIPEPTSEMKDTGNTSRSSGSETRVTDTVPRMGPSGLSRTGLSTTANPPSVPSGSPVKWHCDTCHCAFLEETLPRSAHQDICKNWSNKSYSRRGSAVGYPPDWDRAVPPYPTERVAFWMHEMRRSTVSPNTAAPLNPLKPTAEAFIPAGVNNWSNHESHIARDDAQVAAKARKNHERMAGDTYRPEMPETYKDQRGNAQTIVHNKVPGSADVGVAQASPEITKPSHDGSSPQQPTVKGTAQQADVGQGQATPPIIARPPTPIQSSGLSAPAPVKPAASALEVTAPKLTAPIMTKNAAPTKGMGGSRWATTPPQVTPPQVKGDQQQKTPPTPRKSPCSVCGGNFKGATALASHTPKCKTWAAECAPHQYTHTVNGRIGIRLPPDWVFSHSDNDPDPEWLVMARQKLNPIRDALSDKMRAKKLAEQLEQAAEIEAKFKKAEDAKQAEEAKASQDLKDAREMEGREKFLKNKAEKGGLLHKKKKPEVKKS